MKEIVFADETRLEVQEISNTGDQVVSVNDWTGIKPIYDRFTRENLNGWHYELNGVRSTEDYPDYRLNDLSITPECGSFTVHFHTEQIPEIDLLKEQLAEATSRLAEVEESQEVQDEVLDYLLMGDEEEDGEEEPVEQAESEGE